MKFYWAKEDKTQSFKFGSDMPFKKMYKRNNKPIKIIIAAESIIFGPGLHVYLKSLVDILGTDGKVVIKKGILND